jgi:hypothetical protein
MDESGAEELHSLLGESGQLVNVKFFPGMRRGLTVAALCAEAAAALRQAAMMGDVDSPPATGRVRRHLFG